MPYEPRPGDIGLVTSNSLIGLFVKWGQVLIGDYSHITHVFVVLHDGRIVEAMPGGAKVSNLSDYPDATYSNFTMTADQRDSVCEEAIRMEGIPYSFLDYASLAITHLAERKWFPVRFGWIPGRIRRRVTSSGHMICSQLCAEAYKRAGMELFPDKRLPMDVTPGDLARRVFEYRGEDLTDGGLEIREEG